jgi:cytochrome c oxidase subunit II
MARGIGPFCPRRRHDETSLAGRSRARFRYILRRGKERPAVRRRAIIQMVLIGILTGIAVALIAYFVPWLPERASAEATQIDRVFWFVTIICLAIFALVAGVSIYAGLKFRAPPEDMDDGAPIHGHTGLEILWTAIPTVLVTAISVYSGLVLADIENIADRHRVVQVSAQQFAWSFTYEDMDVTSGELVLPVGEEVELRLTSKDVIHSFWVKEWRMKQDAVPGIETKVVVTPTKEGRYEVICTELCGLGHAVMRARAVVLSSDEFERWADEQQGGEEAAGGGGGGEASGEAVFEEQGCGSCHALADAGTESEIGPDLDRVLRGRDEDFVRESIVEPNAEIAEGYQPGVMPQDFGEKLSDAELDALVTYLLEAREGG